MSAPLSQLTSHQATKRSCKGAAVLLTLLLLLIFLLRLCVLQPHMKSSLHLIDSLIDIL